MNRTVAISNSASPEIIWGLGGPEEDHQLHHCCWTGRVGEREEGEDWCPMTDISPYYYKLTNGSVINQTYRNTIILIYTPRPPKV